MSSEEQEAENFIRFVSTFTTSTKPEIVCLTGGEALLRPQLVRTLTELCHTVGARVCLISGMFFARQARIPRLIDQAIAQVDHFTASLDIFHEQQVSRAAVFRVLRTLVDRAQEVSVQVVGLNEHDPYLRELTSSIREYFDDRVPALVTYVKPVGRGKQWLSANQQSRQGTTNVTYPVEIVPSPCTMAAWPVVTFNGSIVGCCNQSVVDGIAAPPHLQFGHINTDDWPSVRERYLSSVLMRAIRVFGPEYTNDHYGNGKETCDGYCSTCLKLSNDPEISTRLQPVLARPSMRFVEETLAKLQTEHFVARYGVAAYANLVELGYDSSGR